ncbi:MAG TPA: hypothetical protein VFR37_10595, partial [Longimicrobium sp.]|nr:hypothetical protein [Longimicrobium sp.]
MSFTLEITFKCLCYFVPDERGDAPRMHVLLPSTNGHVHDDGNAAHAGHAHGRGGVYASQADPPAVEAHVARLMFPRSGGKLADGGNGRFLEVEEGGNGIVDFEPLEGFTIELPAGGGALVPALPAEVMRRGPVKTAVLDQPAHPDVVSRLVLNAGRATEQKSPAIWSFLGEERPLAQEVVWTIPDLEGNALTWRLVSLNGGEDKPLPDVPANEHGLVP